MNNIQSDEKYYQKEFDAIIPFICNNKNTSKMCKFIYFNNDDIYEDIYEDIYDAINTKLIDTKMNATYKSVVQDRYVGKRKQLKKSICQSFQDLKKEYELLDLKKLPIGGASKSKKSKKGKRSKKCKRSFRK